MKYTIYGIRKIVFRNLAGKPDDYNKAGGKRSFAVVLPEEYADALMKEGFDVRRFIDKETGEEGDAYLKVKVNFRTDPETGAITSPKIYLVNKKGKVMLKPNTAERFDSCEVDYADLVISPYVYKNIAGRSGISAYCDKMFVNLIEDPLEEKYAMVEDEADSYAEEFPFDDE